MEPQVIYQKILQWQNLGTHIREITNHIPSIKKFLIHVTKSSENLMNLYKENKGFFDTSFTYLKGYLKFNPFHPEYRNADGETVLTVIIGTENFRCAKHLIEKFQLKVIDIND